MTTRSSNEGAGLPISFERRFRPWRYNVSHSELSLRSVDGADIIEIQFFGVMGMKLKTVYERLDITLADGPETAEILTFSGVPGSQTAKVRCLTLNDDSFVACLRFSAWARPRDTERDPSGLPQSESTLLFRG
ncbi:hypothetical protein SMC26_22645 [Actinomadura fulvescens]|uniref:Uncharacterized protein n=1 Tax=Actinomadura fulvescens TaxID=46160 RepID=A0ABP6D1J0_9ACTN